MNAQTQIELNAILRKVQGLGSDVQRGVKSDLKEAAGIIVSTEKGLTPVGTKQHARYSGGKAVAVYKPGNLRRSIQILPLRRGKSSVLVGPKTGRGSVDGFYARFLEFGTKYITPRRFIERAEQTAGPIAQRFALELIKRRVERYINANSK